MTNYDQFKAEHSRHGMSIYNIDALWFLKKSGARIDARHKRNGLYFPDDTTPRAIYEITIVRGEQPDERTWIFEFGQSIHGTQNGAKPSAYDVLACLTKYDPGTFENFCIDYGYNDDSIQCEKIYRAVVSEWANVERMFGDVLYDLRNIQ